MRLNVSAALKGTSKGNFIGILKISAHRQATSKS
jgi:hypothetical protein